MKTKSFQKYLEKRLDKKEIIDIETQARLEFRILQSLQAFIAHMMNDYMETNNIGFNELVRKLHWSPTKVAKVRSGEANLTLTSLAHLFALLEKDPQDIFTAKK